MDAVDASWPSNSLPVNLNLFPCPFHLDVDNDGKRDMLVSPAAPNASENANSIWWYKNTGTDTFPVFTYQQNNFLQDNMIEVGEGAYPVFFDFDSDGLQDIIIGNKGYYINSSTTTSKLAAFRNTGTVANPQFELFTTDYANLSVSLSGIQNLHPAFGDLDGDGDLDMMVGEYDGLLHYFQNTAAGGMPANFVSAGGYVQDVSASDIDVGQFSAPQLFDVNRDNKLDLLIGEAGGVLNYYENTGTASVPQWTFMSSNFGGVDVTGGIFFTGYSIPFMFNDSGTYKLLVGSESGYIYHYNNIDGNLAGNFNLLDSAFSGIYEGVRCSPNMADITADGLPDLIVGNYRGGVSLYFGDFTVGIGPSAQLLPDFDLYPNPVQNSFNIVIAKELVSSRNLEFEMYDMLGRQVQSRKINLLSTEVDVSRFENGVYTCKLTNGTISRIKRMVIEK